MAYIDAAKHHDAGIQLVRYPGTYFVYSGMSILCVGTIATWYRRFNR